MNALGGEKSPYLLQHRDNPVHWQPWGDAAFQRAQAEDKPIFLSVGYSTCHWCHVMAHESFESEEIAEVLNAHFVSIKVDREERPDVDAVYMRAVQAMTGQGGWPMSVFLTPQGEPFYAGTYFPPDDRYGRPGFKRLLLGLHEGWTNRRDQVVAQGQRVMNAILQTRPAGEGGLPEHAIEDTCEQLADSFDAEYGGFGGAPKFPRPMAFSLLLRRHARAGDDHALAMVCRTLEGMAAGGIYDQLAGGFARYSVDAYWLVPHFEKMLYDNAQLVRSYLEVYQLTGDTMYAAVAAETLAYVERELTHDQGGFFCAEDADSEGREGAFYVWTPQQLTEVLGEDGGKVAAYRYGVTDEGNFEDGGESVLHLRHSLEDVTQEFGLSETAAAQLLTDIRRRLFEARRKRIHPGLDDKVLTAWNGLMIGAMAMGYRTLREPRFLEKAERAAAFVERNLTANGRLLRRWRGGEGRIDAFLDDYVLLAEGLLDLYEVTMKPEYVRRARALADQALERFWDHDAGGFFYTAEGQDPHLTARLKDAYDGAMPSGNSAAVHVLNRLHGLTGEARYREHAEATVRAFAGDLEQAGQAFPYLLSGLDDLRHGPRQVVIAGDPADPRTQALVDVVWRTYLPGVALAFAPADGKADAAVPVADGRTAVDGKPAAYVCEDFTCKLPVTNPQALRSALSQ